MSSVNGLSMAYLRTSRQFSSDTEQLVKDLTKMYFEVAQAVNRRTIGLYNTVQNVSGNQFYSTMTATSGEPITYRQGYRKVYIVGAVAAGGTSTIPHGVTGIVQTVALYGNAITAGAVNGKYIPIPFASTVAVNQQVSISADDTNIYIINGAAADSIVSGSIVFEYLLN